MGFIDYVAEYFRGPAGAPGAEGPQGPAGPGAYVRTYQSSIHVSGTSYMVVDNLEGTDPTHMAVFYTVETDDVVTTLPEVNAHAIAVASVEGGYPDRVRVEISHPDLEPLDGEWGGNVTVVWMPVTPAS